MNGYPKKFIDNAMKTRQHVREKTEYQSTVSLPHIGLASHKIERILNETGIQVHNSSFLFIYLFIYIKSLFNHMIKIHILCYIIKWTIIH